MNHSRLLKLALLVGLVWGPILFWLTVFHSNPVRLNIVQCQNAQLIVTAELLDESTGEIRITKNLSPWNEDFQEGDVFKVLNFDEETVMRPLPEGELLIPLFGFKKRYRVSPLPREGFEGPTMVYPATEKLLEQLEREVISPRVAALQEDAEQKQELRKKREARKQKTPGPEELSPE